MRAQDFANVPSYWGTFAWQTRNRSPWPSTTTNCYSHEKAPWDLQHSQISWKYIISHSWSYCFWLLVIDFLFSFNDKFRSCQSYQINSTDQKTEVASGVEGGGRAVQIFHIVNICYLEQVWRKRIFYITTHFTLVSIETAQKSDDLWQDFKTLTRFLSHTLPSFIWQKVLKEVTSY